MAVISIRSLLHPLLIFGTFAVYAAGLPQQASSAFTVPTVATGNPSSVKSLPNGVKYDPYGNPVYLWGGNTYWPFSYIDNRFSVALTAYDPQGNYLELWEIQGGRYTSQITIDAAQQTADLIGQYNVTETYTSYVAPPRYVKNYPKKTSSPPPLKYARMVADTEDTPPHYNEPILENGGYTYWPMSYNDNRLSIIVAVEDPTGKLVHRFNLDGCRYIWDITVASTEVTFTGQSNLTCTAPIENFQYGYFVH